LFELDLERRRNRKANPNPTGPKLNSGPAQTSLETQLKSRARPDLPGPAKPDAGPASFFLQPQASPRRPTSRLNPREPLSHRPPRAPAAPRGTLPPFSANTGPHFSFTWPTLALDPVPRRPFQSRTAHSLSTLTRPRVAFPPRCQAGPTGQGHLLPRVLCSAQRPLRNHRRSGRGLPSSTAPRSPAPGLYLAPATPLRPHLATPHPPPA